MDEKEKKDGSTYDIEKLDGHKKLWREVGVREKGLVRKENKNRREREVKSEKSIEFLSKLWNFKLTSTRSINQESLDVTRILDFAWPCFIPFTKTSSITWTRYMEIIIAGFLPYSSFSLPFLS